VRFPHFATHPASSSVDAPPVARNGSYAGTIHA
jgi:hypothetical protein